MSLQDDTRFMALALSLGRRGQGGVWPNPAVGCVIVKDGRIVGRGWTQPTGRPHAETEALAQAAENARGATAYVTLEPCAHTGRTPPCTGALIGAGVARVVIACSDSDPRVNGRGIAMLKGAGIKVEVGLMREAARADQQGFFARIEQGRPMVTLKLASSFDGRIATASGESQWITGTTARHLVHAMRARHDAVMVGGGTARKDDPSLTVRGLGIPRQPSRIVVSANLDLPRDGQLARTAKEIPVLICHADGADPAHLGPWHDLGATLIACKTTANRIDPADLLKQLAIHGLTRIFCEGGGGLAASLLGAGLVDHLIGFTAGLAIGADGMPAIGPLGITTLPTAPRFRLASTQPVGPDVLHIWSRV